MMIIVVLFIILIDWAYASTQTDRRSIMRMTNRVGLTETKKSLTIMNKKSFKFLIDEQKTLEKGINHVILSKRASFGLIFGAIITASSLFISFFNSQAAVLFRLALVVGTVSSLGHYRGIIGPGIKNILEKSSAKLADAKLNAVAQAIVKESNIKIPIKVFVSNSTEMNAFSLPFYQGGGNCGAACATIIINKGLIDSSTTAELRAAIAHECGHIYHADSALILGILSLQDGFISIVKVGIFTSVIEAINSLKRILLKTRSIASHMTILQRQDFLLVFLGSGLFFIGKSLSSRVEFSNYLL